MYNRILVPLDGSDHGAQSTPYARILGKSLGAKVEFYRVFDPQPEFFFPNPSEYLQRHQAALEFREQVLTDLESHSSSLRADGVDAIAVFHGPEGGAPEGHEHGHQYGAPAEHIVQEAGSDQDTLILMATHGRSGVGRWAIGSTAEKVLHAANCPLLLVRAHSDTPILPEAVLKNIVVPTDGSALSESILPHAVGLSNALGSRIKLIRVTPHDTADADERDHLLRIAERLKGEGVGDVAVEVLNGDPATAIVEFFEKTPNSLLAMTTHGHSGLGRWTIGSVTDRVVRHAAGPVLVLRSSH